MFVVSKTNPASGGPMMADTPLSKVHQVQFKNPIFVSPPKPEDCKQSKGAGQFLDATDIHENNRSESNVGGYEEPEQGGDDGEGDVLSEEGHGEDTDGGENQGGVDNTERIHTGEIREPASQDPT